MLPLGDYIRQLREERNISLREFAKILQCSPTWVSDIELSRRFPDEKFLLKIAVALKVPIEQLREHDIRLPTKKIIENAIVIPCMLSH